MKKEGENDQYGHDNEASAIKEHIDITLYKTSKKVQVPEKWKDLDKLCLVGIDIKQPSTVSFIWGITQWYKFWRGSWIQIYHRVGQINDWPSKMHNSSIFCFT